jgi:formylglycine-generating enzyme required for sulfatase activity
LRVLLSSLPVWVVLAAVLPSPHGNIPRVNPHDGLRYRLIPPGHYFTGCLPDDKQCFGLERHRAQIAVSGFWIGQTEVTQAAWRRVMNADPSGYKGDDLPVDRIGWPDAVEYCSRIGMRLPTESEWEYAAYGGESALPKEPLASIAWYDANSGDSTHPVGTKQPNAFGLFDMLGNVWEWVEDAGFEPGEHLLKGGSFYNIARDLRVANRLSAPSGLRHRDLGFRCASSEWPGQ